MDYLWESEEFVDDNTLNVNIKDYERSSQN